MVFKKVYGFWKKSMVSGKSQWFLENDFGFWKMTLVSGKCLWFQEILSMVSRKIIYGFKINCLWF